MSSRPAEQPYFLVFSKANLFKSTEKAVFKQCERNLFSMSVDGPINVKVGCAQDHL